MGKSHGYTRMLQMNPPLNFALEKGSRALKYFDVKQFAR